MRIRHHQDSGNSGIALIIVLIMIVVFGILAARFAYMMKVETTLARHASFSSDLDWAGRSGIEVAKWMLGEESKGVPGQPGSVDSLKCYWAGGPGASNGPCAELVWPMQIGIGDVWIDRPKIVDMERKFNINMADEVILRQAMVLIGGDAGDSAGVVSSILDWMDPDGDTHVGGTESKDYETQDPPYFAKDGKIDDLSELTMVRGVTASMYAGGGGGSVNQVFNRQVSGRRSAFEESTYTVGLKDLFTPISGRLININTASATVLQLIPAIDAPLAEAIVNGPQGRNGQFPQSGIEGDAAFRSVQDIFRVFPAGSNPQMLGDLTRFLTVKSLVFEVRVTARAGSFHREYVAILRRVGPKDIQTLNMYWE